MGKIKPQTNAVPISSVIG